MKRLLAVIALLLFPVTVNADGNLCGNAPNLDAFAFESITVSSTAIGFTSATYAPATGSAELALVYTETDEIRWRVDGSDPTGSVGHLESAAAKFYVCGKHNLATWKAIRVTTDATLRVTYFR